MRGLLDVWMAWRRGARRRWSTEERAGGAGAHGRRWASARARGGGLERRRVAAVVWNGGCRVDERRREIGEGGCGSRRERSGRNREGEAGGAGAREIYDRWARNFL